MKRQRKHYAPEEKVAILRRHLLENEPMSGRRNSSRTARLPSSRKHGRTTPPSRSGSPIWKEIQTKDEVLAGLMAEHVTLRKTSGISDRDLGSARYTGPDRGFCPALVREDRDRAPAVHRVARPHRQRVYNRRERYGKVNEHNG